MAGMNFLTQAPTVLLDLIHEYRRQLLQYEQVEDIMICTIQCALYDPIMDDSDMSVIHDNLSRVCKLALDPVTIGWSDEAKFELMFAAEEYQEEAVDHWVDLVLHAMMDTYPPLHMAREMHEAGADLQYMTYLKGKCIKFGINHLLDDEILNHFCLDYPWIVGGYYSIKVQSHLRHLVNEDYRRLTGSIGAMFGDEDQLP